MSVWRVSFPALRALPWLAGLCLGLVLHAQAPRVRTQLAATDPVWTGQKVTLVVELCAPGYFASAASIDLPDPPGLLLLLPTGSPVVSGETLDGTYYSIQRHELAVYAAQAGEHEIPPIHVRFSYRASPLDRDGKAVEVVTPAMTLTVKPPPGAEGLGQVISARRLQVEETWQPEPGAAPLKPGAAFTRTITFTAPEIPGMVFPPFPAESIPGLRLYPKEPVLLDHSDRGVLSGGRRDTIVYVCERAGTFTVPAVRLTWWDLDAHRLQVIELPARTLAVAAPAPASPVQPGVRWREVALALGAGLLLVLAVASPRLRSLAGRVVAPLRPVHLQPLNPGPPSRRQ